MSPDYLIVGSGLTGAVIARCLHDAGHNVLVLERRTHLGGNVHDHLHPSGIRIHTYGPHYFRTSDERIWQFVNRFSGFHPYAASVRSFIDGTYETWPVNASYLEKTVGRHWKPSFEGTPANFEEACLSLMPETVYEKFVKGYNIKQWGVDPKTLTVSLIKRFDIRNDNESRLMPNHKYQGIPINGYAAFMDNMLKGIPVFLAVDYLKHRNDFAHKTLLIYTGPIDEYFNYTLGKLKYRGQAREHLYREDVDFMLPCAQVNNPDIENGPHIRTIEWKHMMPLHEADHINGTVLTKEVPITPENPENYEYPFPDLRNEKLYRRYKQLASSIPDVLFCGRLGEYRYLDMDKAIGRALILAKKILNNEPNPPAK